VDVDAIESGMDEYGLSPRAAASPARHAAGPSRPGRGAAHSILARAGRPTRPPTLPRTPAA